MQVARAYGLQMKVSGKTVVEAVLLEKVLESLFEADFTQNLFEAVFSLPKHSKAVVEAVSL